MIELPARELRAGDYITTAKGRAIIHRLPIDRSQPFTAYWMRGNESTGEQDFDPDDLVTVHKRYPEGFPTPAQTAIEKATQAKQERGRRAARGR